MQMVQYLKAPFAVVVPSGRAAPPNPSAGAATPKGVLRSGERVWAEKQERYREYLLSPEWQDKRQVVLTRDGYLCRARLPECMDTATQVHHRTYANIYNEPLFELVSVCDSCHRQLTNE